MAITDISISEELETNAPSIKYRGNEGPKSPQEQMQMAGSDRYFKILEFMINELEGQLGRELTDEEYEEVGKKAYESLGDMSGGQPLPQDPTKPVNPFGPKPQGPVLPDRQMAAYGGMMGGDGRRRYGLGSFLKKTVRKIIPNEVADIAVKAAPFIAPFNPLAAGIASGLGSFDQTGSISGGLKSGLKNYALGQFARGVGGGMGNLQTGFDPRAGMQGTGFFSNPLQGEGGLSKLLNKTKAPADMSKFNELGLGGSNPSGIAGANKYGISTTGDASIAESLAKKVIPQAADVASKTETGGILKTIKDFALDNKLLTGLAAGTLGATALMGNMEPEEIQDLQRGEGLDVEGIRAEVIEAYKDSSGEKLKALASKYPFLVKKESIDIDRLAMGGRIGKAEGGIMDLGGMEKDYRNTGGFVDIGEYEKKDDVPARLSVNEFVMTADAVRGMGDGDIDLGAKRMENLMGAMENKKGAQQMFDVSERLSEVV